MHTLIQDNLTEGEEERRRRERRREPDHCIHADARANCHALIGLRSQSARDWIRCGVKATSASASPKCARDIVGRETRMTRTRLARVMYN